MDRNGERIIFYFGIAVILSGIATILSSPVFFEKQVFEEQTENEIIPTTEIHFFESTIGDKIGVGVTETAKPTTETSFLEPTTDEKMRTTLAAATTTETTMTTLAVKEESLPFCQEDPKSEVDLTKYDTL